MARATLGDLALNVFWEAPADAAASTIKALAGSGAGFKLRTGGVTADAFPTGAQIARALVAAVRHRVPIKFTAGLHHPVRLFHESVGTKMHGFLNVLGAGVLAAEHRWSEAQTQEMLADENVGFVCLRRGGLPLARLENHHRANHPASPVGDVVRQLQFR